MDGHTEIISFLKKHLNERARNVLSVRTVYVFGSYALGTATDQSDIDLAFHFQEQAYKQDPLEAFAFANIIAAEIGELLGKKTDVVLLNGSSLEMAYEIVTTGICVYETDPDSRVEHEATLMGLWFDFKPFLLGLRRKCLAEL